MEKRKIQKLGSSSYIVTLPAEWVRKFGLRPGDFITIVEEDGSLRIRPYISNSSNETFYVENFERVDVEGLKRLIDFAYYSGYDSIVLASRKLNYQVIDELHTYLEKKGYGNIIPKEGKVYIVYKKEDGENHEELLKNIVKSIIDLITKVNDADRGAFIDRVEEIHNNVQMSFDHVLRGYIKKLGESDKDKLNFTIDLNMYSIILLMKFVLEDLMTAIKSMDLSSSDDELRKTFNLLSEGIWELTGCLTNKSAKRGKNAVALFAEALENLDHVHEGGEISGNLRYIIRKLLEISLTAVILFEVSRVREKKRDYLYINRKEKDMLIFV